MKIVAEGQGNSGMRTGRTWQQIVDALIKSGELYLKEGEFVSEIEVKQDYGIHLQIAHKA
tara:strand:- start:1126 stop:1305 length:180 start_codon:yes stop_codon:yes gene_type:complete